MLCEASRVSVTSRLRNLTNYGFVKLRHDDVTFFLLFPERQNEQGFDTIGVSS